MGFVRKSKEDIRADLKLNTVQNTEKITDVNPGSIVSEVLDADAEEFDGLYEQGQSTFDGTRIDTATGEDLEGIGAYVGVSRNPGLTTAGNATFVRSTPAGGDFTISQGAIISTQPNTSEEQLKFVVRADTTFDASIVDEAHTFANGIYDYPLNERLISSISVLDGTAAATPNVFAESTDFEIVKLGSIIDVDVATIVLLDDAETADWSDSADASANTLDAVEFRQGSNSLNLGKSGTGSDTFFYEKTFAGTVDGSSKEIVFWMYMDDQATIDKLTSVIYHTGSGGSISNSIAIPLSLSELEVGWKLYRVLPSALNAVTTGFPVLGSTNYGRVELSTNVAGDTIAAGKIKIDFIIYANTDDYTGDFVRFLPTGTLPDDATTFEADYIPLSKEVVVDAEAIGSSYNVGLNRIVFKVSVIPNIDTVNNYEIFAGGLDVEADDAYRERIKDATALASTATEAAIQQAALNINGITSAVVDGTPQKTETDEVHIYNSTTKEFSLAFDAAIDTATLKISDSAPSGPADYIKDTDYRLDTLDGNKIKFDLAGSEPVNGATIYVTYEYLWASHVDLIVAGVQAPLPASVITELNTALDETVSAGDIITVSEPTVISVSVTATITVDTVNGFSFAAVQPLVIEAVTQYINGLGVGADVFLAELYATIQGVEGVLNSSITLPVGDVAIATDEISGVGTITIS